jgi:hypothetical protein
MSAEKMAAFCESWSVMFLAVARANVQFALSSLTWRWWSLPPARLAERMTAHASGTALGAMAAGLAPVRRRAVANATRLRRVRP